MDKAKLYTGAEKAKQAFFASGQYAKQAAQSTGQFVTELTEPTVPAYKVSALTSGVAFMRYVMDVAKGDTYSSYLSLSTAVFFGGMAVKEFGVNNSLDALNSVVKSGANYLNNLFMTHNKVAENTAGKDVEQKSVEAVALRKRSPA